MTNHERQLRTVGEAAELLGLSVRTLHHWEERKLVKPTGRNWSNYRLYSEADIARLQQVTIYRATGMSLDAIAAVLDGEGDAVSHLQRQRDLLIEKETALHQMVQAVEELLEDAMNTKSLTVEDIAEILEDASFPSHQEEAEEKWGDTADWKSSSQRVAHMTRSDWEQVKSETALLEDDLANAFNRGVQPGSPEANELAEGHRAWLSRFFPVTHAKQVLISRGYVQDPRFSEYYESRAKGLAAWLTAIIAANALAHGVDPESASWE